jgi:4-methylaminobutanoate oxidase (formaldehyde-forming)
MVEGTEPVDQAFIDSGNWEIEIADKRFAVTVSLRPLYDPDMKRIKA